MRKTLIALALLVPAVAVAQEKYTNADLRRPALRDAYTNADVERLQPLPVSAAVPPVAAIEVPRDRAAEAVAAARRTLEVQRDRVLAEVAYWNGVLEQASYPGVDRNAYPRFGADTGEARMRLKALDRTLALLEHDRARIR